MSRATITKINQAIAPLGFELVKEPDYFWFAHLSGSDMPFAQPASVYCRKITDLTLEDWVSHVKSAQTTIIKEN